MSFLHPGIAMVAGGLATVPLLIHLLSLRGYRREPWAAMRFLAAAQKKARRRLRFEQWLLLILRTLIVLLIGLTLARPFTAKSSLLHVLGQTRSDRAIILDDSFSMNAIREDGSTAFDKARVVAGDLIAGAEARDGVALLRAGAPAQVLVDRPTRDRQVLDRLLDEWTCSTGMNDLYAALRMASDILSSETATRGGRICYVLTDFTQSALADESSAGPESRETIDLPGIDKLVFINVGPSRRENLAIVNLRAKSQVVGAGIPARFEVELANERDATLERVDVEITVDGATTMTVQLGPILPRETAIGEFELAFGRVGPHRIRARIKSLYHGGASVDHDDPLPQDDERFLVVEVLRTVSVLAVDRTVSVSARLDDLFYYTTALSPGRNTDVRRSSSGQPLFEVKRISQASLDDEILDAYDVVALGNLRRLSDESVDRLTQFVRSGGGLIVFLGGEVSAEAYNEQLVERAMLLPVKLGSIESFDEATGYPYIEIADSRHPATMDFVGNESGGLQRAIVRSCWSVAPTSTNAAAAPRTLLRLTGGEPAAMGHFFGRGRVLLWLTSADMTWTNLPAKPDYVPLMFNLTVWAAGDRQSELSLIASQPLILRYPARLARHLAGITHPDGSQQRFEMVSEETGATLQFAATERPGFYTVTVAEIRRDVAVNIDPGDRDLTRATLETVRRQFGAKATVLDDVKTLTAQAPTGTPREFAHLLIYALLVIVAAETLAVACLGTRR